MANTIEKKVAETILQQPKEIRVGDKTFSVAPPSVATIILASQCIATLPQVHLNEETVVEDILRVAKDCTALGDIVAILILGAKKLKTRVRRHHTVQEKHLFGLIRREREVYVEEEIDHKAELAKQLLEEMSPSELHLLCVQCLNQLQLGDFFGLTTFLCEINLTKPTKVV